MKKNLSRSFSVQCVCYITVLSSSKTFINSIPKKMKVLCSLSARQILSKNSSLWFDSTSISTMMKIDDFRQLLAITRNAINVSQSVYMLLTLHRSVWVVTFHTSPKLSFFPFTSNENGDVSHTPNLHSIEINEIEKKSEKIKKLFSKRKETVKRL